MKTTFFVLFCLLALSHSMAYQDEILGEEETMLAHSTYEVQK